MSDLLPHNATQQETALDGAVARLGDVPPRLRDVWDPAACPSDLLPWLAWSLSVDQWDPQWPDQVRRQSIASAIEVQQIKGTIGAVRAGLASLQITARVLEWHRQQVPGDEYTYKLLIAAGFGAPVSTIGQINQAIAIVDRTKSLRSHLQTVEVEAVTDSGPYVAATASIGNEVVVSALNPRLITVTRAQLDAAIGDRTFEILNNGIPYTLADGGAGGVDTGQVTDMRRLFIGSQFNGDISYWDVSSVTDMSLMFFVAVNFNQPLDMWDISSVEDMGFMFQLSAMSPENYSRTLIGWANRAYNDGEGNGVQMNIFLGAHGRTYNATSYPDAWPNLPSQQFTEAASARAYLVNTMGWAITDGGQV